MQSQSKNQVRSESLNKSQIETAANDLLRDGKKLANALYEDTLTKVSETEDNLKQYSDEVLKKVQQNPFTSVLIAGGVGFLISLLLKK